MAAVLGMSGSGPDAAIRRPETNIRCLKLATTNKADVDVMGRGFRD